MKSLLMIAYHFPPLAGSSGIQRTLRFARYLPEFGWRPIVLTAHPRAYPRCSDDQTRDIPAEAEVIRAQAWDASRHFSIAGRYPRSLARPDRWASWWYGAMVSGMRAIRRHRPAAIWSTYPIATAHRIGASLAARSGLPWIADFRDPMVQEGYPADPVTRQRFADIELQTIGQARISTLTTPSAVEEYCARYPAWANRIRLLENGYDEETFAGIEQRGALNPDRLTLVHSGVVYPRERDPSRLFEALARLKASDPEAWSSLRIRFRAPVHEQRLRDMAQRHDVLSAIEILPPVGYREALTEMASADGLLVLQAANCNAQVPAKLYEYFRAGRPILVLSDPAGDTATVARAAGIEAIAPLDAPAAIERLLADFVRSPEGMRLPEQAAVSGASRRGRTQELVACLDEALSGSGSGR